MFFFCKALAAASLSSSLSLLDSLSSEFLALAYTLSKRVIDCCVDESYHLLGMNVLFDQLFFVEPIKWHSDAELNQLSP